jgi:hypothetical protein
MGGSLWEGPSLKTGSHRAIDVPAHAQTSSASAGGQTEDAVVVSPVKRALVVRYAAKLGASLHGAKLDRVLPHERAHHLIAQAGLVCRAVDARQGGKFSPPTPCNVS